MPAVRRLAWRLILVAACAGILAPRGWAAAMPPEGEPAPAFEVQTIDGRHIDSQALKGKVVMLHFWATWCTPCREEMPALEKFYREHRKDGFEIVAISLEDADAAAAVRAFTKDFDFPIVMQDGADVEGYCRIRHLPASFVIDRKGILRRSYWTGEEKIDAASLERYVRPLLAE